MVETAEQRNGIFFNSRKPPEMAVLRHSLNEMSQAVAYAVKAACSAFTEGDIPLAHRVIENDRVINSFEIDIDKAVVRRFAIDRPIDADLRLLLSIQKINTALERVGDHAVNIAEATAGFWSATTNKSTLDIGDMAKAALDMLTDALKSFFEEKTEIAGEVLIQDDFVDKFNVRIHDEVKSLVMGGQESFEAGIELLRVSQNLERIGDLATNIAEETIFCLQDQIVKHHAREKPGAPATHPLFDTTGMS